jgi:hypothetical protein
MRSLTLCFHGPDSPVKKEIHAKNQKKCDQDEQYDQSVFSYLHSYSHGKICTCKIVSRNRGFQVLKPTKSGQEADKMLTGHLTKT